MNQEILQVKQNLMIQQWQERIHQCQTSGKPVRVWCKENGVGYSTYYAWLNKVRQNTISQAESSSISLTSEPASSDPIAAEEPDMTAASSHEITEIKMPDHHTNCQEEAASVQIQKGSSIIHIPENIYKPGIFRKDFQALMKCLDFSKIDHVYIVTGYTDLRRGIDGLALIVQDDFHLDPFSKSLFLFCGRKRTTMKGLLWEGDGFIMMTKRLNSGSFQWPRSHREALDLSEQQVRWLLEGLSIIQKKEIQEVHPQLLM